MEFATGLCPALAIVICKGSIKVAVGAAFLECSRATTTYYNTISCVATVH